MDFIRISYLAPDHIISYRALYVDIVCSIIPEYLVKEKKFDPMEYPGDAMDITSYLSLQGYRDAQFLLNCIEEEELDNFVLLLRTVRLWAKANYVFSSTFGFLSGITCAIMALYILKKNDCQVTTDTVSMIRSFFRTFAEWPFPEAIRVPMTTTDSVVRQTIRWDEHTKTRDTHHSMVVLAPSQQNTTASVTDSHIEYMQKLLQEASKCIDDICNSRIKFSELFAKNDEFFHSYREYVVVTCESSANASEQEKWSAFVRSRMAKVSSRISMNRKVGEAVNLARTFRDESTFRTVFIIGICVKTSTTLDLNAVFTELKQEVSDDATDITVKTLSFTRVHRCNLSRYVPGLERGVKKKNR